MASTYTSITITDGTTTLNLNDGTSYVLLGGGWSPRVARRLQTNIGNRCPYEDVSESMQISILGTSPSDAISKLNSIINLFEQAARYSNLENVSAVTLQVEPQGVTAGQWKALVLSADVILPNDWADNMPGNVIETVTLKIVRRGLWTRNEYTSTTVSSVANQRLSGAMTLTDPGKQGYVSELLCTPSANEGTGFHPGYLILTNATNKVQIFTGSLNTNDSANKPAASATNITTWSAGSITIDLTTVSSPQLTSTAKRVAILGTFKTTNTAEPLLCRVYSSNGYESNYFTIPSYTAEDVQFCGVFNWSANIRYIQFSAATASIYFDMGVLVDVSDTSTSVVKFSTNPTSNALDFHVVNAATDIVPTGESKISGANYDRIATTGDMWMPFNGTSAYAMRFARGSGNLWQPCTATPTAITNSFRVKALEATLIPR